MRLRSANRIKAFLRTLAVAAMIAVGVFAAAQTSQSIDSLHRELAKATTPADSVAIMHNMFDCIFIGDRRPLSYQIYETAERAKDYRSMLEILYVLALTYQHEPDMEKILVDMAERVPESEIQRSTLLYIKLRYQSSRLNRMTEEERQEKLHQALKDYRNHDGLNKYERIACLFLICTNLRNTTDSELLAHYLQELQSIIEEFPNDELSVRNLFYGLATNVYIESEMYERAVASNKRMIELIRQFDRLHESQGRIFRNYDGSYYQCYLNMLKCAQILSDEEIDSYYQKTVELAEKNPRIKNNDILIDRTKIYYLYAKGRFSELIPLLKEKIKTPASKAEYYHYARLLVRAARATGDKSALLQGSKIINSIYRDRLMAKPDVSLGELQTIYDVENLKDRNRNLTYERQQIEIRRRHQVVVIVTIAVAVAIAILIVLLSFYIRSRLLARRLSISNKRLTDERNSYSEINTRLAGLRDKAKAADNIRSNFVENMSEDIREPLDVVVQYSRLIADYGREDERPYIQEYSDAMSVNTDLLIRLVNDILDLPQIESGELDIRRQPSSVKDICNFALEVIRRHLKQDVVVVFTNVGQPDVIIDTDPQRVEQVLIQVLTNAAKFTEYGSITFGYEIDQHHSKISFTVADTGIGVPEGGEEKIFERFVKMDPTTQGGGLGLYIGKLMANMLGGDLTLDSSYRDGARFVFTIPIE